eukprot:360448-Chlamydomonas_euryale.AAC.1
MHRKGTRLLCRCARAAAFNAGPRDTCVTTVTKGAAPPDVSTQRDTGHYLSDATPSDAAAAAVLFQRRRARVVPVGSRAISVGAARVDGAAHVLHRHRSVVQDGVLAEVAALAHHGRGLVGCMIQGVQGRCGVFRHGGGS